MFNLAQIWYISETKFRKQVKYDQPVLYYSDKALYSTQSERALYGLFC